MSFVQRAMIVLGIPAVEALLIRAFAHSRLGPNVFHFEFSQSDIWASRVLITLIFLWKINSERELPIRFQRRVAILNAISFFSCLGLLWFVSAHWEGTFSPIAVVLVVMTGAFTGFTATLIFFSPAEVLARMRSQPNMMLAAGVVLCTQAFQAKIIHIFWSHLARMTGTLVAGLLRLLGMDVTDVGKYDILLKGKHFSAIVGPGCSGLEGIFFFISLFSILLVFESRTYPWTRNAFVYVVGCFYMFALNIVRISLFFAIASWIAVRYQDDAKATRVLLLVFHSHIGWVIYLVAIFMFFLGLELMEKKRAR